MNSSSQPKQINPRDVLGLRQARLNQIKANLKEAAGTDFVLKDTEHPDIYSLRELAFSYIKRCWDISQSIEFLESHNRFVPAVILARSMIETVAMGRLFIDSVNKLIESKNYQNLSQKYLQFFLGSRRESSTLKGVHINDALRHLIKVDLEYVKYLFPRIYGEEAAKSLIELFKKEILIQHVYDDLSEVAHPNGTGTHHFYPFSDGYSPEKMSQKFKYLIGASIWQSHHLLRAIKTFDTIEERFGASFKNMPGFATELDN